MRQRDANGPNDALGLGGLGRLGLPLLGALGLPAARPARVPPRRRHLDLGVNVDGSNLKGGGIDPGVNGEGFEPGVDALVTLGRGGGGGLGATGAGLGPQPLSALDPHRAVGLGVDTHPANVLVARPLLLRDLHRHDLPADLDGVRAADLDLVLLHRRSPWGGRYCPRGRHEGKSCRGQQGHGRHSGGMWATAPRSWRDARRSQPESYHRPSGDVGPRDAARAWPRRYARSNGGSHGAAWAHGGGRGERLIGSVTDGSPWQNPAPTT